MGPFVYPKTLFSTNNRSHYFRSLLFAYFCTFNRRLARPLVIDYFSSRKSYLIISSNKVRYLCFDFYYTESFPIFFPALPSALPSIGEPFFFPFCLFFFFRYHFKSNNPWGQWRPIEKDKRRRQPWATSEESERERRGKGEGLVRKPGHIAGGGSHWIAATTSRNNPFRCSIS